MCVSGVSSLCCLSLAATDPKSAADEEHAGSNVTAGEVWNRLRGFDKSNWHAQFDSRGRSKLVALAMVKLIRRLLQM